MPALTVVEVVHCASNAKRKREDQQGMFCPGKHEQKTGCPSLRIFFFPPPGVASARLRSFPWQQAFQTARRGRWRAETEARGKGGGVRCRVLYFARRFPAPPRRPLSLGSVRRCANSAHAPTHRRLCIKCPTLCAAAYFFTAFPPYTSISVILLVVFCRRHFWFGLGSFILRSFVLFSPTISRGPISFLFFFFCGRSFAWLLKQCALGRISLCRKRMLPCSLSQ